MWTCANVVLSWREWIDETTAKIEREREWEWLSDGSDNDKGRVETVVSILDQCHPLQCLYLVDWISFVKCKHQTHIHNLSQ